MNTQSTNATRPRRKRRSRFSAASKPATHASQHASPDKVNDPPTSSPSIPNQTPPLSSPQPPPTPAVALSSPKPSSDPPSQPLSLSNPAKRRRTKPRLSAPKAFDTTFDSDASADSASAFVPLSSRLFRPSETPEEHPPLRPTTSLAPADNGPDPLDDFFQSMETATSHHPKTSKTHARGVDSDHSDSDAYSSDAAAVTRKNALSASRPQKRAVYEKVNHAKIDYPPFQKDLYIEVPELTKLSHADVAKLRRQLGNIRIRGKRCPKPITDFSQSGLSSAVLDVLRRAGYEHPTPIQAQGIPCLMSGRDVIGVARTGSGKTLAFLLPVLRHIALQPRAGPGEGPAAVVIAPTRELAIQIYGEAKKFSKAVQMKSVCAYGGSGVKDQIAELKRGADIVICTPGRMIDLLAMNSGRISNLRRVTFVVLDEADRMFDMGFEPQLTRIVENIRPDRQTVMFSATFPAQVEKLARKILQQPLEIMVGGNSVAASTIDQYVEVRSENSKFLRLLELLGKWYEVGSTLIFVDRQDNADRIFRELVKARYKCLSLHGGMDQADRDSAIVDFKNGVIKVLVATSVAARGLDVKNLTLVVNYDVPSHYEDYVHRVGRTGRAGRSGTAYTFITQEQESFAPDLVKALELSARAVAEQEAPIGDKEAARSASDEAAAAAVPEKLRKLADAFDIKHKAGIVRHKASSGYGGKGFSFDNNEEYDAAKTAIRKMQAKQYGIEDEVADEDAGDDNRRAADAPSEEDADENDGIIEITVVPKATGREHALMATGDIKQKSLQVARELSPAQVAIMLSEAVKRAEKEAVRLKLDEKARCARVATAKATVLSIAAMQNKKVNSLSGASASVPVVPSTSPTHMLIDKPQAGAVSAAAAVAAAISAKIGGESATSHGTLPSSTAGAEQSNGEETGTRFAGELEINDYPQHARWEVTRKGSLNDVEEFTGCVVTTRGNFYAVGRNPPAGERKLHFLIEGPSRSAVRVARRDIKQKLEEAAAVSRPSENQYSKYSVV